MSDSSYRLLLWLRVFVVVIVVFLSCLLFHFAERKLIIKRYTCYNTQHVFSVYKICAYCVNCFSTYFRLNEILEKEWDEAGGRRMGGRVKTEQITNDKDTWARKNSYTWNNNNQIKLLRYSICKKRASLYLS